MLLFQTCCSFYVNVTVFLLDIFYFSLIHLLKFKNSFSQKIIFILEVSKLVFISIFKIFIFLKLRFKLSISVSIGCFEFRNLILQKNNLGRVVFLKSLNFDKFLSCLFLFSVLKLSFHIIRSS